MHTNNWLHVSYQMTDWLSVYCFAFRIFWERRQPTAEWNLKKKQSMCCALFVSIGFFYRSKFIVIWICFRLHIQLLRWSRRREKMCATDFKHFLIGLNINKIRKHAAEKEREREQAREEKCARRAILFWFWKKKKKRNKINTPTRHVQAIDGNNYCNCIKHKW